nr:hypothetical protein [Tanacetum cinerariifolium]
MHKAFPLPGIEFPLAEEVPTASEEGCHCQKKREATARKIALLSKSRRNCQSKSNDSFTKIELISDLVKYQDNYAKIYKFQSQQRKPWTKKQKRDYYMAVIRSNLGWKEIANKQKTSKEVTEEAKSPDEVPKEKVKEMMQLVPIEEVYVEALQVKHHIIDWKNLMHAPLEWKLYDSRGVHHVTAKDKEIFMLVEKDYPHRKGLALVMISYKLQVENYSRMANDLILKIYKIASTPGQQGD